MPEWLKIVLCILAFLIVVAIVFVFVLGTLLAKNFAHPNLLTYEHGRDFLKEHDGYGRYDSYKKIDYQITLRDGYKINIRYIPQEVESKKYIIIAHGVTANMIYDAKYADLFYDLGYNLVTFDERGHGRNEKTVVTMGLKEGEDLVEIINDTRKRYGDDIYLGVHGESMGAATTLMALKYKPNIKFAICDCPYADLEELSYGFAKKSFHLPKFIVKIGGFMGKIIYGYNALKVKPIENAKDSTIPLLLCTGENDNLIPKEDSQKVYDIYKGFKMIHYTKGADHAESISADRPAYVKVCKEFLKKVEELD